MTRCAPLLRRAAAWMALALLGCAATRPAPLEEGPLQLTATGTAVFRGEFEFQPPPATWKPLYGDPGGEFVIGFLKPGDCPASCQSTFVYDEEPFGVSRDLETRLREFMQRFLWASRVVFDPVQRLETDASAGDRLVATVEGSDPTSGQKVRAKLLFTRRGERVVSFYLTQWRPLDAPFDPGDDAVFDRFVESFGYRKPSFYETL